MIQIERLVARTRNRMVAFKLGYFLAILEIQRRYNRSIIGPFWITISSIIVIFGLTLVYGTLFGNALIDYLFYLCPGFIFWTMLTGTVVEATESYLGEAGIIRQYNLNLKYVAYKVAFTNLFILFHNLIILFGLFIFLDHNFKFENFLLACLGLILGWLNILWVSGIVGLSSLRFRDLKNVYNSIMTLAFFATPIIWKAEDLRGNRSYLIEYNPIYYFLEMFRGPITGNVIYESYFYMAILAVIGLSLFKVAYQAYEKQIVVWL